MAKKKKVSKPLPTVAAVSVEKTSGGKAASGEAPAQKNSKEKSDIAESRRKKQEDTEDAPVNGIVYKNRFMYWIAGGVVIAGGTVYLLNRTAAPSEGIPTPPSPPR
jgi:Tfp pilus assembly protein FimV